MPKTKLNGSLKYIVSFASLIMIIGSVVGGYYVSKAEVKNSVDTTINEKIEANDIQDDLKFFPKEDGTELKANQANTEKELTEIKESIVKIEDYQHENRELLVEIKTIVKQQQKENP